MSVIIQNRQFDEERALYNLRDAKVINCSFAGPADGESALKESRNIQVEDCTFRLRYPLWHVNKLNLSRSVFTDTARAALWYDEDADISDCSLEGVKALRECSGITLRGCTVNSAEFGWKSRHISLLNSKITSEYLFLDASDVTLDDVLMNGKYSFQYVDGLTILRSTLDTKDAFWHARNVTVTDSIVKGEYLGWFSDGLTLINCRISGTQPLCYCKNLRLVNCTMEQTDLAFEYSDVEASITGHVDSIKNPRSGHITADSIGEIIHEAPIMDCSGEVIIRVSQSPN